MARQVWGEFCTSRQSCASRARHHMALRRGVRDTARRAVDQHGAELDILLQKRGDKAAARRFFNRVLAVVLMALRRLSRISYAAIRWRRQKSPNWQTSNTRSSKPARVNNHAENGHQPTRKRERRIRRFRVPERTQVFCRTLDRSGSTLRSSDICCAPHFIANSSTRVLLRGIV